MGRPDIPRSVRNALPSLVAKQNGTCIYCREPIYLGRTRGDHIVVEVDPPLVKYRNPGSDIIHTGRLATIEHIKPLVAGGTHDLINLAAACYQCNNNRGIQYKMAPEPEPNDYPLTSCRWCNKPKTNLGKLCDVCRKSKLSMDMEYRRQARKRVSKYGKRRGKRDSY